jgi:hypothetical protein
MPVFRPCLRALSPDASSAICHGESVGGIQETVLTGPPSWSTVIKSLGWLPSAAACWSLLVIARSCAAEAKL